MSDGKRSGRPRKYKRNPEKLRAAKRRYYDKHKEQIRLKSKERYDRVKNDPKERAGRILRSKAFHRMKMYGMTIEQYDQFVAGPCAICWTTERPRRVDHDHATGRIRGALCHNCNIVIGLAREDVQTLARAAYYVAMEKIVAA